MEKDRQILEMTFSFIQNAIDKMEDNFQIFQEINEILASIPEKIKPLLSSASERSGGLLKRL